MNAWTFREAGIWKIGFRLGGRALKRSLKTRDPKQAEARRVRVEANLRDMSLGLLEMPPGADPLVFLLTNGLKISAKPATNTTIGDVFASYFATHPAESKSPLTLYTEHIHAAHLKRLLGEGRAVKGIDHSTLQVEYINHRMKEKWRRGQTVKAETIKKELSTLRVVWNWGIKHKLVTDSFPGEGLVFPNTTEKSPFQTREEIEQRIRRGGLSDVEQAELWDSLYLNRDEINDVLAYVKKKMPTGPIYPMFCLAAFTGARRSEIMRLGIDDVDLKNGVVKYQEKKRKRGRTTYRHVPILKDRKLVKVLRKRFADHPGGKLVVCEKAGKEFTPQLAAHRFRDAIEGSEWEGKMRGWHCFRHSFASHHAARGVDDRYIDSWLGHSTESMRRRYQHLRPDRQRAALDPAFG